MCVDASCMDTGSHTYLGRGARGGGLCCGG